ncbi:MAG: beta-propeller domain-containing protein, partial [Nitrososphaera sp.]
LSNDQPKVLGELKLPGFSNYLHPYDGSHVIGIGREGTEAGSQGVKVALFDVSEVSHPKAVDTYVVGGSQTDSEVLRDHKALLFDREKDVLSIPISSYDGYYSDNAGNQDPLYRESAPWIGFYVFGINPQAGIELKGTIQHNEGGDGAIDMSQGSRSFFIQETLYTVTPALIKMNNLNDVEIEMNSIPLSGTGEIIRPLVV